MAEYIAAGAVLEPYLSEDGKTVELGGHSLRLENLASVLRALHSIATDLLTPPTRRP